MIKEAVYIEPQTSYSEFLEKYGQNYRADRKIFVANAHHSKDFLNHLSSYRDEQTDDFIQFDSVDQINDSFLYKSSYNISELFCRKIREYSYLIAKNEDYIIPHASARALIVSLHDRIVSQIRPFVLFQSKIKDYSNISVYIVPRSRSNKGALKKFFRASGIRNIYFSDENGNAPVTDHNIEDYVFSGIRLQKFYRTKSYDFRKLNVKKYRDCVFMLMNMKDRQYKYTALPILWGLSEKYQNIIGISIYDKTINVNKIEDLYNVIYKTEDIKYKLTDAFNNTNFYKKIIDQSINDVIYFLENTDDFLLRGLSGIISEYIKTYITTLLIYSKIFHDNMYNTIKLSKGLIVCPGRYLEANILVGLAKKFGIHSIEIQSGTISPSPRFVQPYADEVLCIDPLSHNTYSEYLKKQSEAVHIVGSPKMDFDLHSVRDMSCEQARSGIPEILPHRSKPILTLATQPIGLLRMEVVVRTAIVAASSQPDTYLFIKQHPNETDAYAERYRMIAKELNFLRLIVSKSSNILHCIVASNIVLTYYSTVGLEAFALRRPVICINPFVDRPPFDLVRLGFAYEANNSESLSALLREPLSAQNMSDPRLNVLQDGRSVERCIEHMQAHFSLQPIELSRRNSLLSRLRRFLSA